jgi:hypothetical protein
MPHPRREVLKGTLDMLILKTLTVQPMHGYAIALHIERFSGEVLSIEQGSLYPALERLQKKGLVTSKWGDSPTGRRAATTPSPRPAAATWGRDLQLRPGAAGHRRRHAARVTLRHVLRRLAPPPAAGAAASGRLPA